jgi:hypothetical protein
VEVAGLIVGEKQIPHFPEARLIQIE